MEQHIPIISKKAWNMLRLAFFMLRKGICKRKLLLDLNLMMQRRKLASKVAALKNLTLHHNHHHHHHSSTSKGGIIGAPSHLGSSLACDDPCNALGEYEFSCSNTPVYYHHNTINKTKTHDIQSHQKYNYYMASPSFGDTSDNLEAVNKVLEIMSSNKDHGVRQLRITDSPFPLRNDIDVHDQHVDEAAEKFINKFYSQLKEQNYS